jgi:hypothetical protein
MLLSFTMVLLLAIRDCGLLLALLGLLTRMVLLGRYPLEALDNLRLDSESASCLAYSSIMGLGQ